MLRRRRITLAKPHYNQLVRHHIVPKSRHGANGPANIARIKYKPHDLYHQLFRNKTPEEIMEYLVNYFWKGQWEWVTIAQNQHNKRRSNHEKERRRVKSKMR